MSTNGKRESEQMEAADAPSSPLSKKLKSSPPVDGLPAVDDDEPQFIGQSVPANESREKWPHRYQSKSKLKVGVSSTVANGNGDEKEYLQAKCHYTQCVVDGCVFKLYDDTYVKAEEGQPDFIARIVEMFETLNGDLYFSAQWFYRAQDTVIKEEAHLIDKRRVFYSEMKDDNPLNSIVSKVKIIQVSSNVEIAEKEKAAQSFDLYYDMEYSLPFNFTTLSTAAENQKTDSAGSSVISSDASSNSLAMGKTSEVALSSEVRSSKGNKKTLLDLYSGCGAMSTGLCFGANMYGVNLVTRWAVDINKYACESLELNHAETVVRNEKAEDFLSLLKEWEKLCKEFNLLGSDPSDEVSSKVDNEEREEDENDEDNSAVKPGEFEVRRLLAVCYGDPNEVKKPGLYFKVRWKGYGPSDDTWEPIDGLGNCEECLKEFVSKGYNARILPLPGDVDFICGGPPCQGISGYNRFRNSEDPLKDPKNHQLVVYMDIIDFLKPNYILMENVCDIVKFAGGRLGSHAIGRLVSMNYQARLRIMAAGSYGVPQCRLRVFLWGAKPTEILPQFPLPTHAVVGRGVVINEFKDSIVGCDEEQPSKLEKSVLLGDAISDMPPVENSEHRDEIEYSSGPRTSYQKFIRLKKQDLFDCIAPGQNRPKKKMLYDHLPLELNDDDYARVCQIPKRKGANFRDLPGVLVNKLNKVEWDPNVERVLLPSGKPLVPDYAMSFVRGTSTKPFGRLGMDDIVTTVVTRAEPHNQVVLHPNQDRVLTVRENARLQGFPDCYKLCGPVKERYMQIGNAVAFSVSTALGYTLAQAIKGVASKRPLTLPVKFPDCLGQLKRNSDEEAVEEA